MTGRTDDREPFIAPLFVILERDPRVVWGSIMTYLDMIHQELSDDGGSHAITGCSTTSKPELNSNHGNISC